MSLHPAAQLLNSLLDGEDLLIGGQVYALDTEGDICVIGRNAETGERLLMPTNLRLKDFVRIGQQFVAGMYNRNDLQ